MNRPVPIDLPVGPTPGWELNHSEDEEVRKSIPESCVILHSLRRSRERWLSSTFPRFSTKARAGKTSDIAPPPHTIQTRGKCDLEIGPHIFPETVFYEVHYLSSRPTSAPLPAYPYQSANAISGSWQSITPYNGSYTPYVQTPPTSKPAEIRTIPSEERSPTLDSGAPPTPLISSLTAVTTITPALINQVNAAASSNPILANLLQLAAAGKASPEQLKTLGLLIQSLATPGNTHVSSQLPLSNPENQPQLTPLTSATTYAPTYVPSPAKEFDLVIEFRECSSDRWIFPRGLVTCERVVDSPVDATCHAIIKARLPFHAPNVTGTASVTPQTSLTDKVSPLKDESAHVVTFHLKRTPLAVWDTLSRWVGDAEKIRHNDALLQAIENVTNRAYLGYQLAPGPLLSQLQSAASTPSNLKLLKPGPLNPPRPKRKIAAQQKPDGFIPQKRDAVGHATQPEMPKRRRTSHAVKKSASSTQIQCISCNQTDVPLILGGRFCRPCVESGRSTPAYNLSSHTSVKINPTALDSQGNPGFQPEPPPLVQSDLNLDPLLNKSEHQTQT